MESLATNWTDPRWGALTKSGGTAGLAHPYLADYGGKPNNFLECIPSYVHTVAALQAQNAKMLRVVATNTADQAQAAVWRQQAAAIATAVEKNLYVQGKGYFGSLYPNGSVVGVQTCLDFMYVSDAIAHDLSAATRAEMVGFFGRELQRGKG